MITWPDFSIFTWFLYDYPVSTRLLYFYQIFPWCPYFHLISLYHFHLHYRLFFTKLIFVWLPCFHQTALVPPDYPMSNPPAYRSSTCFPIVAQVLPEFPWLHCFHQIVLVPPYFPVNRLYPPVSLGLPCFHQTVLVAPGDFPIFLFCRWQPPAFCLLMKSMPSPPKERPRLKIWRGGLWHSCCPVWMVSDQLTCGIRRCHIRDILIRNEAWRVLKSFPES